MTLAIQDELPVILYREELARQAMVLGLKVHRFPLKSGRLQAASSTLGTPASRVTEVLVDFGETVGAPWKKEHKQAAAAALCVLAGPVRR